MSVYDYTTEDDCEVIETTDVWSGPHLEHDHRGELTGAKYYRCRNCGREVLTGRKEFATHREGCKFAGGDE